MPDISYVRLSGSMGADSSTGDSFYFETTRKDVLWVPYSVCRKRRFSKSRTEDQVEVEAWWAHKKDVIGELC